MNRALFFLLHRSVKGRLIRMLRMARQPKYLVGVAMSAIWISLWALPWLLNSKRRFSVLDNIGSIQSHLPAIQLGIGMVLACLVTIWWLLPFGKPSIGLREAELQILLCSPLPRREIIRFALLKGQAPILLGSTVMTIFVRAPSLDRAVQHFLGVWLLFTVWDLHSKAKRLWLGRTREVGPAQARFRVAVLAGLLVAGWGVVAFSLLRLDWSAFREIADFPGFVTAVTNQAEAFGASPGGWILAPFAWIASPLLHNHPLFDVGSRALSFVPALGLLAFHEEWVVRSQTRFEEATLEAAQRASQASKGQARQARKSKRERLRQPFRLAAAGAPEVAIVWKNLMLLRRTPVRRQIGVGVAVAFAIFALCAALPVPFWVLAAPLMGGLILSTLVPMVAPGGLRNDFRADLKLIETLRPWPIAGWRIVAAEVLAPVVVAMIQASIGAALLLAGQWASLARDLAPFDEIWSFLSRHLGVPAFLISPLVVVTALPLSLALGCFSSAFYNVGALAFPGWVPLGTDRKEVAHAMGSNLVLAMAQMLGMALCLLPGLAVVAGLLLVQVGVLGIPFSGFEMPLLSLLAAAPPILVSGFLVALGGSLWEQLDPSKELLND